MKSTDKKKNKPVKHDEIKLDGVEDESDDEP